MLCRDLKRRAKRFAFGLIFSSALVLFFQLPVLAGQSVTLFWDPSSDSGVAGYRIYYGSASHSYTSSVDVGSVTNATIVVPSTGTTYYFAATSYDRAGNESDFSNETTFTLPVAATLTSASFTAGQFSMTVDGTPGSRYAIQASTNLVDWIAVQTNTAPFVFVTTNTAGVGQCFYRSASL